MKTADKVNKKHSRFWEDLLRGPGKTVLFWCLVFFIASIFLASLVSPHTLPSSPKRVLFISSYHPGFPTFFEQIRGIQSVFAHEDILLDIEFMDSKRFAGEEHEHLFHQQLTYKLAHTTPYDLVLSADDAALLYLLKNKKNLFPEQPLVFFGVNNIATAKAQNARKDITGVIEAVSMEQTIELMLALQPESTTILALVDDTPSGQGDLSTFRQVASQFPQLDFTTLNLGEYTFKEYAQKLQSIGEGTSVLLLSAYGDSTGQRLVFTDSLRLILNNLNRPLYHLWYHGLGDGIVGGKVISHYEQGKTAANMALRILQSTPVDSIPVVETSPNISVFDYNIIKKYNLSLKNLPQGVQFLHRPISFYQQHKYKVWTGALFFIVQSGIIVALVLTVRKIKKAEKAARERERFLDAVLQTTAEGFVVLNREGFILETNQAYCAMLGYSKEELIGRHMATIDIHETKQDVTQRCNRIKEQASEWFVTDHRRKDGSSIPLEISVSYLAEQGGQFVSFCRDLSERKQAEEQLQKALQQTHIITSNLQLGLLLVNDQDRVEYINQTYCDLMGIARTPEEIIGMSSEEILEVISEAFEDPPTEVARIKKLIASNTLVQNDEFQLKNNRTMLRDLVPIVIDGIPYGRLWYLNNITELRQAIDARKELEQQLVQAQKMEAIGMLAGGIAHDFNNILSAVIGYGEMAQNAAEPGSKIDQNLSMVLGAANRATELVRQILAFSRRGEPLPIKLKPAQVVGEAVKLLRSTIPTTITIQTHLEAQELSTLADPVQLQQVVLNLCTNAFHAMEKTGGTISISLKSCIIDEEKIRSYPQVHQGEFVQLTVADTGPGVPPLLQDKIFEPYFTTKKIGKGTGMGLAIVHSILTAIGGFIEYEGIQGQGATFHVYLPVVQGEASEMRPTVPSDYHGSGHILLVDDETILTEMAKEMLTRLGYSVTACTKSREALDIFKAHPEQFAAVITDQTMPEMTGSTLAQALLEIRPNLPIILSTGYSQLINEKQAKNLGIQGYLTKPYSRKQLGAALKQVLQP